MSGYTSFSSKYPPLYKSFVGKRATAKERVIQALPVGTSSGQRHISTFTGRAIEVEDNESIRDLHENGCFGMRASSRATARSLRKDADGSATEKLLLFPEEAFFLSYSLNCLEIRRKDGSQMTHEECLVEFTKIHPQFITSFVVYTYLRSKNWVIKSGIKLGGDFCKKMISISLLSLTLILLSFQWLIVVAPSSFMPPTWCLFGQGMSHQWIPFNCKAFTESLKRPERRFCSCR